MDSVWGLGGVNSASGLYVVLVYKISGIINSQPDFTHSSSSSVRRIDLTAAVVGRIKEGPRFHGDQQVLKEREQRLFGVRDRRRAATVT